MRDYIVATTMAVTLILSGPTAAEAWDDPQPASCQIQSSVVENLQAQLASVVKEPDKNGGLFSPNRMWSAIVDRVGTLCVRPSVLSDLHIPAPLSALSANRGLRITRVRTPPDRCTRIVPHHGVVNFAHRFYR